MHRFSFLVLALGLLSCGAPETDSLVTRLVDVFPDARVTGTPAAAPAIEPIEWAFDGESPPEWGAGTGVTGSRVSDGHLVGRSTTDIPIVTLERTGDLDDPDVLHEVVVRARVSDGANLSVNFTSRDEVDIEGTLERMNRFPWEMTTPVIPGDEVQTYRLSPGPRSISASGTRHVLLRPTDVSGADFEVESVRLVFRKEHLATIPSGVSWQGLSDIFRETVVTRSPETVTYDVQLPQSAFVELALGTVEDWPVTFRVTLDDDVLLERTLTTPYRWEEVPLRLEGRAGPGKLSFSATSAHTGALAFWGAPSIRDLGASPQRSAGEGHAPPKRVFVVLLDTLRSDHLDAYGYERETAPTVTKLAEGGALFADAIAQGAWTKVSVPSLLSSTYPTSNGIVNFTDKIPAAATTLAESFRDAGYATWAASGNGFAGRRSNLHQGVEVFHESSSLDLPEGQSRSKDSRVLVDRLLPWLEAHRDVPFFVYLHATDPHTPLKPYAPYDTLWTDTQEAETYEEQLDGLRPVIEESPRIGSLPVAHELEEAGIDPDAFVAHELAWYDGSTLGADVEIRRVLEKLRELEIEDDTLIVFLSDHGEEFLDHGGHFHEENVYGELVNVPLVFHWPGVIPAGTVAEETVQLLDVSPTILDLAGLEKPELMQGVSLMPLMNFDGDERRWSSRPAISEWKKRPDMKDSPIVDAFGIIVDGYKLVHNIDRPEGVPEFELYDHRIDPLDQNDIADENPEIVERLSQQLADWHQWAQANALPTDAEATEGLDAEELERLRSLGYVQ